ncbi:MAG: methyltransferase domain-containing protein [bacterium]
MTGKSSTDWNPETYAKFRGLRLRPALDLLMQVGALPKGQVLDLGCGDGAAAAALKQRYPKHELLGLDASPAMLAKARGYDRLIEADAARWAPDAPLALIFSNAALHWLPDHAVLLARLASMLAPGGVLAVQMPRQYFSPSHRFLRDIATSLFPERFDTGTYDAPVQTAAAYWQMLAPLGHVEAWETEYVQHLEPTTDMHPVRAFTQSTAMRPFVEKMSAAEQAMFVSAYDKALASAYPVMADGSATMPFRRIFFVLRTPDAGT